MCIRKSLRLYRPISNLSVIRKVIERIAKSRITDHLTCNQLFSPLQSAYRKFNSDETVLLSLHDHLSLLLGVSKLHVFA